jgi:Ca2+-binding EF-hand superfamily protein
LKYVKDVNALQQQNVELQKYVSEVTKQKLTEEFLAADIDNNRQVTRAEFEMYKKEYIKKHPEMANVQFPAFEEFDPDHNGVISMSEHEQYYERQGLI